MTGKYDVNGRTVLITGAARGIGAAIAERLHAKGANVALVGLEPERLEQLAERLGDRAVWREADVTDLAAMERAAADTVQRFGGVDVAIANAGVLFTGPLATAPIEQVERTLTVNLLGVWRTDRAVLRYVIERRGYMLNVASVAAASHPPLMGAYVASKAGVEALTDSLRQELAAMGADVGCAYFGIVDTDMGRDGLDNPATGALSKLLPSFARSAAPVSQAVDAIEKGVERRSSRVWAPRYVGGVLALRWWLQHATELRASRSSALAEALRLSGPASGPGATRSPTLPIAPAGFTHRQRERSMPGT